MLPPSLDFFGLFPWVDIFCFCFLRAGRGLVPYSAYVDIFRFRFLCRAGGWYHVTHVWDNKDLGVVYGAYTTPPLNPHASTLLRIQPVSEEFAMNNKALPSGV